MSGRIDFSLDFNAPGAEAARDKDRHYRIYILGNFAGKADIPWEQRKISPINIDTFDQVMTQLLPVLELDNGQRLSFETLDDFHPDVWGQKIPILADLLELKRQLSNPVTAERAAAKIKAFLPDETKAIGENSNLPKQTDESQEEMLERLLGKKPEPSLEKPDSVERLVQQIVSPYVSKGAEPEHQALIGIIDKVVSQYLHMLLHRPDFQSLEALWQATAGLINEELSDQHDFFLIDISKGDLLNEFRSGRRLFEQKLMAHIQIGDGEQEVLLIGDYCFSDSEDDLELLGLCGRLARECQCFFLSAPNRLLIENTVLASASNSNKWGQFRRQSFADNVILAYPRFLLRLPYGEKRDPLEMLSFEEIFGVPESSKLLWGNSAFLCARVFIRAGQGRLSDDALFFGDVPVFTFDVEGEQILQPGAESVVTEKEANDLLSNGIMPVIAYRQRQGVRLIALSALSRVY